MNGRPVGETGAAAAGGRPRRIPALAAAAALAAGVAGCVAVVPSIPEIADARMRTVAEREHVPGGERPAAVIAGKLTLGDALRLALGGNKALQAAWKEHEIARGRVLESYGVALPNLTAGADYARLDEVPSFDVGGQEVSLGVEDNYAAELTVRQPLFRGGAIPATLRTARLQALLSDETIRAVAQDVIFRVARDYYGVLLAQQLRQVAEEAVVSAVAHLEDVRRKRANGVASDYDVLRAEVDVSNFRAEFIQRKNELNLATTQLLNTMGVAQDSEVVLVDNMAYRPLRPVFEEAVQIAHTNRSDIFQAELDVRLRREAVRIARSAYWPQIDAFFTQEWANPDPHSSRDDDWGDAWTGGLSLSLPIFDGCIRRGRLVQERARLEQSAIKLLDAEEAMAFDVRRAVLSLRDAEELVESQKMNLKRAEEGLRLVESGYREGVNTEVEVTDARTALTRTAALHYEAIHAHVLAKLNFQRVLGILGPRSGDFAVQADEVLPVLAPGGGADEEPAVQPAADDGAADDDNRREGVEQ